MSTAFLDWFWRAVGAALLGGLGLLLVAGVMDADAGCFLVGGPDVVLMMREVPRWVWLAHRRLSGQGACRCGERKGRGGRQILNQ